ncbi:hypothetical protein [Bradyrhizobium cosmicum]|uniref:Uncharacterized protein n=1 Tax=Bradyrhizobium cosmicum TaxID=1404864 RepID=A0AAI8Q960_9BRAD|nr:hypothetical protein [Bradyrhizobium cosmicum]BAL73897.1 hypothetical protein S23_06770 [Bradyrhizobium cosmicum]
MIQQLSGPGNILIWINLDHILKMVVVDAGAHGRMTEIGCINGEKLFVSESPQEIAILANTPAEPG